MLYEQFLLPTNRTIPLVMSENGIDCGTCGVTHCSCSGGWKGAGVAPADYLEELKWYDSVMQADSYVVGSTIFSLEIPGWDSFDIAPIADDLAQYLATPPLL